MVGSEGSLGLWSMAVPSVPRENDGRGRGVCRSAHPMRNGQRRVRDLARSCFSAQLADCFNEQQETESAGMVVGQSTSHGHARQASTGFQGAGFDIRSAFPFPTESQVFQMQDNGVCEVVV